jgi:hypothetical protein
MAVPRFARPTAAEGRRTAMRVLPFSLLLF